MYGQQIINAIGETNYGTDNGNDAEYNLIKDCRITSSN